MLWNERRRLIRSGGESRDDGAQQSAAPADRTSLYPLRENIEVAAIDGEEAICCSACGQRLCSVEEDWTSAAMTLSLSPDRASPAMAPWIGHARLVQLCCPACGALFDSDFVEAVDR